MQRPTFQGSKRSGFTLIELLIAAAMGVVIVGISIGGLITVQNISKKTDRKLEQQAELQRALNYIASDIQEGSELKLTSTSPLPPPPSPLNLIPIFNIPRSNGSIAEYYYISSNHLVWQNPVVIFRWLRPSPLDPDPSNPSTGDLTAFPLIDAIAETSPQAPSCQVTPGLVSSTPDVGLKIIIPVPTTPATRITKAKICLRGTLATNVASGIDVSLDASIRSPTP
jgi:type II secretory pathway pseudopilin PulG